MQIILSSILNMLSSILNMLSSIYQLLTLYMLSICLSVCLWCCALWLNVTAKVSEQVNRKCPWANKRSDHISYLRYLLKLPTAWAIDDGSIWWINHTPNQQIHRNFHISNIVTMRQGCSRQCRTISSLSAAADFPINTCIKNTPHHGLSWWCSGSASDSWSKGNWFNSWPGCYQVN